MPAVIDLRIHADGTVELLQSGRAIKIERIRHSTTVGKAFRVAIEHEIMSLDPTELAALAASAGAR